MFTKKVKVKSFVSLYLVDQLFHKRLVCIRCHQNLSSSDKICSRCTSLDDKLIATIFDVDQSLVFTRIPDRILADIEVNQKKVSDVTASFIIRQQQQQRI